MIIENNPCLILLHVLYDDTRQILQINIIEGINLKKKNMFQMKVAKFNLI